MESKVVIATAYVANCMVDNQKITRADYNERHLCLKVQRTMSCKNCIEARKL